MQQLQADMGNRLLGPWRSLLMPRPTIDPAACAASATAAAELAKTHFEDAGSGGGVITELLEVLLLGLEDVAPEKEGEESDLPAAIGALFPSEGRQSVKAERVAGLIRDLREQHAALGLPRCGQEAGTSSSDLSGSRDDGPEVTAANEMRAEVVRDVVVPQPLAAAAAPPKRASRLAGLGKVPAAAAAAVAEEAEGLPPARGRGRGVKKGEDAAHPLGQPAAAKGRRKAASGLAAPEETANRAPLPNSTTAAPDALVPPAATEALARGCPRAPALLVLGPTLHALPWETVPGLAGIEFYRSPSLLLSCLSGARFACETGGGGKPCDGVEAGSAAAAAASRDPSGTDAAVSSARGVDRTVRCPVAISACNESHPEGHGGVAGQNKVGEPANRPQQGNQATKNSHPLIAITCVTLHRLQLPAWSWRPPSTC